MAHKFSAAFAAVLLLAACDGGGGADAGSDAGSGPAIVLTIDSIERVESVPARGSGAYIPTFTDRLEVATVTLSAVREGPLPVAPIAFQLTLTDNSTVNASPAGTNVAVDGCDSRSVPEGESTTCVVVFEVNDGDASPRSITWSNGGSLSTVARIAAE
ncbi:MAG: hypothetical protein AB8I08_38820 [Sandaracinaceae bacterium]